MTHAAVLVIIMRPLPPYWKLHTLLATVFIQHTTAVANVMPGRLFVCQANTHTHMLCFNSCTYCRHVFCIQWTSPCLLYIVSDPRANARIGIDTIHMRYSLNIYLQQNINPLNPVSSHIDRSARQHVTVW